MLSPLSTAVEEVGGRWRSFWPYVETVVPRPADLPWAEAGVLLARLHREAQSVELPPHGWPERLRRALDSLPDKSEAVRRAAATLPDEVWRSGTPGRPATVVHGDFHLGQLGRLKAGTAWLLIDVDDLGIGDPAWDLARPAGLWAAGLIPDGDWTAFVDAYRGVDGPAISAGDPWPILEPFARAAVVQAAANHPDDELLLAACARMAN